jgi:hypothetical protein
MRIFCQVRPSAGTGSSRVSTGVPSASVAMTVAPVEGAARTFTRVPPAAPMTALAVVAGVPGWSALGAEDVGAGGRARTGAGASVGGGPKVGGAALAAPTGSTGRESTTSNVPSRGAPAGAATLTASTGRESTASGVAPRGCTGDGELQATSRAMLTKREKILPIVTASMCVLGTSGR